MSKGKSFIEKAISYYVDSYTEFHNVKNDLRYDSFVIKLHIAYTSLFLEIYKKHNKREYLQKLRKKELCLLRLLNIICNIDCEWTESNENCYYYNLKYLIERRDLIVHVNASLSDLSYNDKLIFNATFRNFFLCFKKNFPSKTNKIPEMLQLFSYIEESQFIGNNDKKNNTKFLETFLKKNPNCNSNNNLGYPSLNTTNIIFLSSRNDKLKNSNKPHITVCQVDNPTEAMAQISVIIEDNHNLTPSEVCNQFNNNTGAKNSAGKDLLNHSYSFPKIRKLYNIESNQKYCKKIILNPDNATKKKEQIRYSKTCVDFLINEYNTNKDYFLNILAKK